MDSTTHKYQKGTYRILVEKLEGKRFIGVLAHRWEYNKMHLK
jgi:hypothetical protein